MNMGRPEPCVLFAQTFVHPTLDEYVDEVLFAEPVVVTACEFLEQNSSSTCSTVKLSGTSSPPSFALEVFVQCEGETRFRRLCQPFLYSHSSSNVLEVEAMVTSHLVVRGSYRGLSLVIYGNTAEDLGQFNIEVDLDSSLTHTVSAIEGDLEDLPPALCPTNLTIEESLSTLNKLSFKVARVDIPVEHKQFLQLMFKLLESQNLGAATDTVISSMLSAALVHATPNLYSTIINQKHVGMDKFRDNGGFDDVLNEARKELMDVYKTFKQGGYFPAESSTENMSFESEADMPTSKQLVDLLSLYFKFGSNHEIAANPVRSKHKSAVLWLSVALLLCSGRESCFHFVSSGGMEKLGRVLNHVIQNSLTLKLLSLAVVEQATRHSIGCEGFLGWWPREDESVPPGTSEGYNQLLKFLLQNQRHDVASLATYILNRLRFYEVASRYECAVLSVLGGLSTAGHITSVTLDMLTGAKFQLKKLTKLINFHGPIEDPSLVARASSTLIPCDVGSLSYKATSTFINQSNCCFSKWDTDPHLLLLLKERGFLPLSAAFLSCSILRTETGRVVDLFMDIVSYIEAIILSLLFSRSGLTFLLCDPEVSTTVIRGLRGTDDWNKEESASLRYASALISRGFFCHPQEVGIIVETHLKAIVAIDHLITSTPNTEEFLWILWELCGLSRSDCGRQALLALIHFPEALSVLTAALHSLKELDPVSMNSGSSPLNVAIFHAAAEIFEVIVTDSTSSSLGSWIDQANELHRVLHSSSPGSNRKDAPARLLEWIDAGVVYHRNGFIGLLRYVALLASGGDAHMASTSIFGSDMMDVENVVGEAPCSSDGNVIDNLLGKRITDKDFPGVVLRDSSIVQLTTAFRILAFISDNSAISAVLYDEGAVMVIHAVLINCKVLLERSSNIYDYLVDEGTECNSTSDLLLERNREQSIVDLLIPSLVLLINLLQKLQEAKEQHRNTKLINALLQLHREVSPRLAACAFDLSSPYPEALGLEAVCHLIVSALACWPVYGWTPGLFLFLLDNLHSTSSLALGPKEVCSLFCLLNDLFPEEGVWLWKNGIPMSSLLRAFAVGTLLGREKERQIDWYLQAGVSEKLLSQLTPQLDKVAQVILHCAISTLVVIQDMIRVFIIRIACHGTDNASVLLRPMISWISNQLSGPLAVADTDSYKVYRLLDFLALLLEHPRAKPLLLREGGIQMFVKVLERCNVAATSDAKQFPEVRHVARNEFSWLAWCIPVFKSISLLCDCRTSLPRPVMLDRHIPKDVTAGECLLILSYILNLCKVLPVGKELLACVSAFKELGSSAQGRSALLSIFLKVQPFIFEDSAVERSRADDRDLKIVNACEWRESPPLQICWSTLLMSIASNDGSPEYAVETIGLLASGALLFCLERESLNLERITATKFLFGIEKDGCGTDSFLDESMKSLHELANILEPEVMESASSLLLMLQKPTHAVKVDDIKASILPSSSIAASVSTRIHRIADSGAERIEDYDLGEFGDKFLWECPENLRDRLTQTGLSMKRKISSLDGPNRRVRADNASTETIAQSSFSRGSVPPATSGPTRRDTFRQRKPNTSRPPSMHVDDYVARERNADGNNNPNVIAIPRIGSSSGRPPSIHVDEFMARQRDRQHPVGMAVSDATAQVKRTAPENNKDAEKSNKSRQLKPDLDDDLQGIDIVFDAEESEPDEKLPFPQADDNLPLPAPVVAEQSSPHSIVEETESDSNLNAQLASNMDENTNSEFSSMMTVSRPEGSLAREPSISSDKKFPDKSDDSKSFINKISSGFDSAVLASSSELSSSTYANVNKVSGQLSTDSRMTNNLYSKVGLQHGGLPSAIGSQGFYDKKFHLNQPPLPPYPPPPTISPSPSQNTDAVGSQSSPFVHSVADVQPPLPPGFHVQAEYQSAYTNSSLASSSPLTDSKFGRATLSSPGGSTRPPPPLPPTPPPYSVNASTLSSSKPLPSQSVVYSQSVGAVDLQQTSIASSSDARPSNLSSSGTVVTSFAPAPLGPPLLFGRPGSMPGNLYGSSSAPQHMENLPNILQNLPISLPAIQSVPSLTQLQPLQPPQIPRHTAQSLRPVIPSSPQPEQVGSLLPSSLQLQMQTLQMLQQPHASPAHLYYQTPQTDNVLQPQLVERSQLQPLHQQGDGTSQQHDAGMSLQDFFRSPEAIQSLLSDRDKLCQLLEQHPKLMQMLQDRLGQL
ncbi:protein virilizer homolog [Coffea eugenioides]|uniref:protein virilizer homolog n=1 Tax=Coffea eugenioides TaxID=49369 RepID=UPI000F612A1A|nr:protein virilizer homolog [Coffea eugenioides]